jgi:hypothetical protein
LRDYWNLDWTIIRRVFIRARQQFGLQSKDVNISKPDMNIVEVRVEIVVSHIPEHRGGEAITFKTEFNRRDNFYM